MKVTMPNWHADARRMREQGHSVARITVLLRDAGVHVSESRVSQVTNANWQNYIEKDRIKTRAIQQEVATAKREGRPPDTKQAVKEAVSQWIEEKQAMSDRGFEIVTSPDPTDNRHKVKISCSHEGCANSMIFARTGVINPTHAAKWFRDKGWSVGNKPRQDLCPEHHHKPHLPEETPPANGGVNIVMVHDEINAAPMTDTSTVPVRSENELVHLLKTGVKMPDVPPLMTRADRRIVHNKLEEVYVDEFIGYKTGWDDMKVSIDLGCPTNWVSVVREESFGPEITEARKKVDLIKLGDEIMANVHVLRNIMIPNIAATIQTYDGLVAEIDGKLDNYEKMHAELTASILDFNTKLEALKA